MFNVTFSNSYTNAPTNPTLVVQVLSYDPYPVSAGDWFDLWVKVQNIGQQDANNVRFELIPSSPFSSNDTLVRDYGVIYGTVDSYKVDQTYDSSQVILKYRVKVDDNAPQGTSNLKLAISNSADPSQGNVQTDLPIVIGDTKTDFEIVPQASTTLGTSFSLVNTGDNDAVAVIASIPSQNSVRVTGPSSTVIGNLAKGDFTTFSFQVLPSGRNVSSIDMQVSYTDTAGIRNTVTKTVPFSSLGQGLNSTASGFSGSRTRVSSTPSYTTYFYIILGIIIGIVAVIVYGKIKRKK